jgi:hypothetical protein
MAFMSSIPILGWGFAYYDAQRSLGASNYTNAAIASLGMMPGGGWAKGSAVQLYHGTSSARASRILTRGLRPGYDDAVFFAEEFETAAHFAREGAQGRTTVMRFTIERNLADELGLMDRALLGEARGLRWVDIQGGTGFERILMGDNIRLFNEALENGAITVQRLQVR